ncbi:probable disease resistance protein At4g27220 [Andrographis paniculata]|uniref:probable disease resistance protein At4g27220 n=1 Tax=Andrographis paniculata TaxID=175694 RepID=UPI0021E7210B|nr:probable disease resistance protein At4g27220 [Andrographis paniculata]
MAVIAAVISNVVWPAIELGKLIYPPIKRQFTNLCCFNGNLQSLRDASKRLDDAREDLQMQIIRAKNNGEQIVPQVHTWLKTADEIQGSKIVTEVEVPKVGRAFLNIKSRFSLSKKANETAELMRKLRHDCRFDSISHPALPAAMAPSIPNARALEFESRKHVEAEIIEALRSKNANMIGVCGLGGVGKTTMVRTVMNRAKKEGLFDEVVMVVVGKEVDLFKLQHEIAELLGLKFSVETLSARAHQLCCRLMDEKRKLLVLDDVWKSIRLEDLGISCNNGCRVILTSRDRGIFRAMDMNTFWEVQILLEREAWSLFKEKTGDCVVDENLVLITKEVAKECKGLPIALITVGRALKDQRSKPVWEHVLDQLRSANPEDIRDVIAEVYNHLKLSYDFLDNKNARSLFLLSSLFPEDSNIYLEHLTWYAMGLGVFEGIRNMKEARNKVHALVDILKDRFLVLDGRDEHHVKMHDVVRDVAVFIASKEGCVHLSSTNWLLEHRDCTWISVISKDSTETSSTIDFRRLNLLFVDNSDDIEYQLDDRFFEGMRMLKVLFLRSFWLHSLPRSIEVLKHLHTLHLDTCTMKSIAIVGEMLSLEILSFRSCHWIEELPVQLGRLNRLRLLEFSDCTSLETIQPGIISRLARLEELKMLGSFRKWEAEENGKNRRNVSLVELQYLTNLASLEIEIGNFLLAAQEMCVSPKIQKFDIRIYGRWPSNISSREKKMLLRLPEATTLGNWVRKFVTRTEFLDLTGDGSHSLDLRQVLNVKSLGLNDCSTVRKVVNSTASIVFPVLESMWLCRLPRLEEICDGPIPEGSISFRNLKELTLDCLPLLRHLWKSPNQNVVLDNLCFIHVWMCDNLRNLFSLAMARGLSQLEMLEIRSCERMEEIFLNEDENHEQGKVTFPKLKRLSLGDLPRLATFFKGIETVEFPRLTYVEIDNCPNLASFASDESFHLFCNPKVSFESLKELYIHSYDNVSNAWCRKIPIGFFGELEKLVINNCNKLNSLFTSSIAENLVKLKELTIQNCVEMVTVLSDDENVHQCLRFPCLETLELRCLNLRSFYESRCDLEFPALKYLSVFECPHFECFTRGSLNTLILKIFKIDNETIDMENS